MPVHSKARGNSAVVAASNATDGAGPALARRWQPPARFARLALVSAGVAIAAGLFALYARRGRDDPGAIVLFQREEWRFWVLGVGLAALSGVATARFAAIEDRSRVNVTPFDEPVALPTAGLYPSVATFSAVMAISVYHSQPFLASIPILLWVLLSAGAVARAHLDDEVGTIRQAALTAHVLLTHVVAFLALAMIYINKVRSLLSATTVAIVAGLLFLQLTDGERFPAERRFIYGLVGAVVLGEVTWALNYWPLTGWTGGALLLVAFYFLAGLILAQVRGGLRAARLAEYGLVSAIAFAIITYSLWRGP